MSAKIRLKKCDVAAEYLRRFPNTPSLTLARKAYIENPALWPTLDACRTSFRYLRGAIGQVNKPFAESKGFVREKSHPYSPFDLLPQPKTEFEHWESVNITGDYAALVLSDVHVPYYNKPAIMAALRMGRSRKCNMVILNGDILDHYSISRWEKDPRKRNFAAEVKAGVEFLETVRECFPKARIIYKLGNHEERFDSYMRVKAPELLDVDNFRFEEVFEFSQLGFELVRDMKPIKLGELFVIHGHEYRFAISNPVNAARGLFLRAKKHATCGHFHRSSQHSERNIGQSVVSTWSAGCLCDLHPEYNPINEWNHGHQVIEVAKSGEFSVDNFRTINGVAY